MLRFFVPSQKTNRRGQPAPLDGLNELIKADKMGYGYGNAMKRRNGKVAQRACELAMGQQGWTCPNCRSIVTLTFVEPHRRRDPDNIFGGAKFILDGITMPQGRRTYGAGAIVDDSQKWIELRFGPILVDSEHPGCWVEIEVEDEVQDA